MIVSLAIILISKPMYVKIGIYMEQYMYYKYILNKSRKYIILKLDKYIWIRILISTKEIFFCAS